MNGSKWSISEQNAMELLYRAGWRWSAISAHVSGIHGKHRSAIACQRKCKSIGLTDPHRVSWKRLSDAYNDDLRDMMVLDYSTGQMADELTHQYGQPFSQAWVHKRLRELPDGYYAAWRKRVAGRLSRSSERGWMTRRRAAA